MRAWKLLDYLPPFKGLQEPLIKHQDVDDIIDECCESHELFAADYDRIIQFFDGGTITDICKRLFNFCKENFRYDIETVADQNTMSPAAIISIGHCDCKGYAGFIAGVLDAIARSGSRNINWCYRFASYRVDSKMPGHVFVVVFTKSGELWIDPVLETFNQAEPSPVYWEDIKCSIMLSRISGLGDYGFDSQVVRRRDESMSFYGRAVNHVDVCDCSLGCADCGDQGIGTTASTGAMITKISATVAVVPVYPVSTIIGAAGAVIGFFLSAFGNKYSASTKVRWLTQAFEFYVMGNAGSTSDNKVSEANVPTAQKWFSVVLGVPIYDICRWHTLRGENCDTGKPLGITREQAIQNFLNYPDIKQAGVTYAQAAEAAQIASTMQYKSGDQPGLWKNYTAAPSLIDYGKTTATNGVAAAGQLPPPGSPVIVNDVLNTVKDFVQSNPLVSLLLALGIGYGVYEAVKD